MEVTFLMFGYFVIQEQVSHSVLGLPALPGLPSLTARCINRKINYISASLCYANWELVVRPAGDPDRDDPGAGVERQATAAPPADVARQDGDAQVGEDP